MALKVDLSKDRKPFTISVQGGKFLVQPMTMERDHEITEAHTDYVVERGVERPKLRSADSMKAKAIEIIKDWDLETLPSSPNEKPKPIPCTPENIATMVSYYLDLIGEVVAQSRNIHAVRVAAIEKN